MERARVSWTDERLDDFSRHMDSGFERIGKELQLLRTDTGARFDQVEARLGGRLDQVEARLGARIDTQGARIDTQSARIDAQGLRMDEGFHAVNGRIDEMQRLMVQLAGGTIATILATFVGIVLTR